MRSGVGIDLGSNAVRAVELRVSEKGAVVRRAVFLDRAALAAREVEISDRPAVLAVLKREMTQAGMPAKQVAIAISGKDSIIRYTHVPPVPPWRLKIIMDYEVGEVAEKIGEKLSSDYRVLPVTRAEDEDQAVIIGLSKESTLDALLDDLQAQGITVAKAIPGCMALHTAYAAFGTPPDLENPEDELVILVDLGAENLHTSFILNGNLAFARSASFGGRNFTEVLARDLAVDLEKAELLKIKGGTLEAGGGGRREETVNPLRGAAAQLVTMLQSALKLCRTSTGVNLPEPTRYVLLGGAAALPGLAAYLQAGLKKPVEAFQPRIAVGPEVGGEAARALAHAPGNFAVALGMAASVMRREGIELSLLPTRYLERRRFRDRTLYMYLAAAFLLVFLAAGLVQAFGGRSQASARKSSLDRTRTQLEASRQEMLQNTEENLRSKARINRILREAELVAFQAFVLDFLAQRAGSELKITSWRMVLDDDEDQEVIYRLLIDGAADNASQKAHERIRELEAAIAAEARVERVQMDNVKQVGNWYEFQINLLPSSPAYR